MIDAYKEGVPAMASLSRSAARWRKFIGTRKKQETYPVSQRAKATQHDADFMVKDSKRFADSGRLGWGAFGYDAAVRYVYSRHCRGQSAAGKRREVRVACHTVVQNLDYVFTEYGKR